VKRATIDGLDNATKLQIYALYKQATEGECNKPKPGMMDFKGKAMWDAWTGLKGMPKADAMAKYVVLIDSVSAGGGASAQTSAPASSSSSSSSPAAALDESLIKMEVADSGVATIFLESLTCPPEWFGALGAAVHAAEADPRTRVILVRPGKDNKHLTYGLDLMKAAPALMNLPMQGPRKSLHKLIRDWQDGLSSLERSPKPVIVAVSGWCIGAGLEMAAAADIRICSADAKFSLKEAALGIVADLGGLQRLPPIVGQGNARYFAMTAGDVGAERAMQMGLVSDVLPDRDSLLKEASAMAERMALMDADCLRGVKHVMEYNKSHSVDDGLKYVAAWNASFLDLESVGGRIAAMQKKVKK